MTEQLAPQTPDGSSASGVIVAAEGEALAGGARRSKSFTAWLRAPVNLVAVSLVAFYVLVAIIGPFAAPYNPLRISLAAQLQAPSLTTGHFLGTDHLGRDILSRLLYGARVSITVGIAVVVISSVVGIVIGLFGAYSRRFGNILMRVIDGMMAFPEIVFALALIAALGSSLSNVIVALTFVYVPRVARVVHASSLALQGREFVRAAEALGGGTTRIAFRHILPNVLGPVIVQGTFIMANAVISEASLTFLGVGLPPGIPSWGIMLSEGRGYLISAPWITTCPGAAILVLVLGLNILGDSLRDVLDLRSK